MLVSLPVLLEKIAHNSKNVSRFAGLVTNADLVKTPELRQHCQAACEEGIHFAAEEDDKSEGTTNQKHI